MTIKVTDMKKQLFFFLLLIVVPIIGISSIKGAASEDLCAAVDTAFIKKHVAISKITIASKRPVNGMCEVIVRVRNRLVPLYAGKDFILAGDMYRDKNEITKNSIDAAKQVIFKEHLKALNESVAFTYEPKAKKGYVIYMFVGPLCPYCHDIVDKIKALARKYGVTIKTVLYPVHGEKGNRKSIEAICRGFDLDKYNNIKWKKKKSAEKHQCARGKKLLKKSVAVSEALGVDGVPAFYLDNGIFISGGDLEAIERALKKRIAE
ncbi:MAG: thioredoxin fold domain-containing protein [bacterium]|nr:thioredoxin fold domain-containing protein [bacterium]